MLTQNQIAPDLSADSISGDHIDLSALRGKKVLVKFHRFSGCPVAQRQINELISHQGELNQAGIESIVLLHSSQKNVTPVFREVPGLHIVADRSKTFYRRFHSAFRLSALFSLASWLVTFASFLKGYFPIFTRFEGGVLGVPSDFLVDERGVIAKVHYGRHFGDSWSVAQVLENVKGSVTP